MPSSAGVDLVDVAEHLRGDVAVGVVAQLHLGLGHAGERRAGAPAGRSARRSSASTWIVMSAYLRLHARAWSPRSTRSRATARPSTWARRRYSALRGAPRRRELIGHDLHDVGRTITWPARCPVRSRISPRGAAIGSARTLVDVGLLAVLAAGEHLQVPKAEEHDREQRQRDPADDRHAQRQLRRHRQVAFARARPARSCARERAEAAGRVVAPAAATRDRRAGSATASDARSRTPAAR